MNCTNCHSEIAESSNYCSMCGTRQGPTSFRRRLMLSSTDSKIAGVCGGLAEYFDVDPTLIGIIWVALSVIPGALVGGVVAYILAWIIFPKAPASTSSSTSIAAQPAQAAK
jgi:phage shock protein C